MSFEVRSTDPLAAAVAGHPQAPPGAALRKVPELAGARTLSCSKEELLGWMGWLTAGPPSLTAEALRAAGGWALVRYFWALGYNARGALAPTPAATAIRHHNRVSFSEAVGVGVAGKLACEVVAPRRPVLVANLDDTLAGLVRDGVLEASPARSKHPDYLLASPSSSGWELIAIECKGTVLGYPKSVEQMARGVKQVQAVGSDLPLRRLLFGTTLQLDDSKKREVNAYAVEAEASRSAGRAAGGWTGAILDAALVRALRVAGAFDLARLVPSGDLPRAVPRLLEQGNLRILGQEMLGTSSSWAFPGGVVEAQVGVQVAVLRALLSGEYREERLLEAVDGTDWRGVPRPVDGLSFEYLMPDGIGIRLAFTVPPPEGAEG